MPRTVEKERLETDEVELMYLGFGSEAYRSNNPMYEDFKRPDNRINTVVAKTGGKEAREQLQRNVETLREEIVKADPGKDFAGEIKRIITEISRSSGVASEEFIKSLDDKGGLFQHLDETQGETVKFFAAFQKFADFKKMGPLFSSHQQILVEFAAKTHDLAKLLGTMGAQIDPDHEIIYSRIICPAMIGKTFTPANGKTITFRQEDADFVAGLVGFHEDIWREKTFADQVSSLQKSFNTEENPEMAVQRARMIFHIMDIFGNALEFDEGGTIVIGNKDDFQSRFVGLFRRHINLPIKATEGKGEDYTKGKVFRPEWGFYGVAGLIGTLNELKIGWGINTDPSVIVKVQGGIMGVIEEAIKDAKGVLAGDKDSNYKIVAGSEKLEEALIDQLDTKLWWLQLAREKLQQEIEG